MELPPNFRILDAGTQEYIRDLLRQLNEARSDLDRARTDFGTMSSLMTFKSSTLIPSFFSELEAQVQSLLDAA